MPVWLAVQFEISDFGFEMQDSSNFKIFLPQAGPYLTRPRLTIPNACETGALLYYAP